MISTYLRNKIQNYLFTGDAFTPPTKYYVALSKTQPMPDGSGVIEPVGMAYERMELSKGAVDFTSSDNGVVENKTRKMFNESTGDWGNITHYAIYDQKTGGNMLWYNALEKPRNIQDEMQMFIDPKGFVFSLS